jgi:hypothetical protein
MTALVIAIGIFSHFILWVALSQAPVDGKVTNFNSALFFFCLFGAIFFWVKLIQWVFS